MCLRSWYTIPKDGAVIVVDYRECDPELKLNVKPQQENDMELGEDDLESAVKFKLRGDFYQSMKEVTQKLNVAATGAFAAVGLDAKIKPPTFYYRAITRRIYVAIAAGMSIKFPPSLESILGLTPSQNPMCNM